MTDLNPGQQFDFEQIDADAVCEQCSSVNPDATLICKTCGNNLRDQRMRRIATDGDVVPQIDGISRFRVFTALLTTLGILIVFVTVLNISDIEAWLVSSQLSEDIGIFGEVWTGPEAELYEELVRELRDNPVTKAEENEALSNPVIDTAYNGRYVLSRPDRLRGTVILGYANLRRRGDVIYFVARLNFQGMEVRGVAELGGEEGEEFRFNAMRSASIRIGSNEYLAGGYAVRDPDGGHICYAQSGFDNNSYGIRAHRIR